MSTTDDRIVTMQFDNADFEHRLSATLASLDKLNQSIQNTGTKNGLDKVQESARSFDTSHMSAALDAINSKFSVMGAVGFSAIQKITQGVMGLAANALNTAKTDILAPIISGGKERATALEQAKFQFQGLGIDVNAGMASALAAVKGTAYGLQDAATVAAQFGASGIKAGDDMTRALTGISGIAAMTGRSYSEIGQIFTSAAGAGKVSNMDLQEFAIRGLNAAAAYAKQTGKTEAQVHAMATAGTLDFKSFADAMDKAFGAHATEANKTYTGSLSNLHAALARMGAAFFSDRLDQERDLFNALTPVVDALTTALKPLTTEILKVTGAGTNGLIKFLNGVNFKPFGDAIKGFVKVIADGATLVKTWVGIIRAAFVDIFPPNLVPELENFGNFLDRIIKALTPTGTAVKEFTKVFEGLFAILSIVGNVIRGVFDVLASFFDAFAGQNAGGALKTVSSLADELIKLQNYLVASGRMFEFFQKLAEEAKKPVAEIQKLVDWVKSLFTTTQNSKGAAASLDGINKAFDGMSAAAGKLQGIFGVIGTDLDNLWSHISTWFSELGQRIAATITPDTFRASLSAVNTGLLAGIGLLLKGFLDKGFKFDIGGTGIFGQLTTGLHSVNQTLKLMQTDLKAKTLMEIAASIGILAASITVLSLIKPDALQRAMVAMAVGFGQLVIVMKELDSIGGAGGAAKLTLLGTSMVAMAGATVVLATAVKILSGMDAATLQRGLTGVAVALGMLVAAVKLMSDNGVSMVAAGVAMNAMATGLVVMAGAVRLFATMSWDQLIHGLAGIGATLLIIAAAMHLMPVASTVAAGVAMIPLAIGITILAGAVHLFATMSWAELGRGLVGLAGGLVIVALAMNLMPLSLPITAAGLILVGIALGLMVPTIKLLGDMDIGSMAKALGGLAIMLGILALATAAMSDTIAGSAALLIAANALLVLSGVLKVLGSMSWGDILKGLGALAAVLAVLGLSAFVLQPVIPALLALGAAMTLVGAGFALFGAGAFLVASAFSIMAVSGAAGAAAIIAAISLLLKSLPNFVGSLITSLEQAATAVLKSAGPLLDVVGKILDQILKLVIKESPNIANALVAIITAAMVLIRKKFPDVAQTAFDLLETILKTLDKNLPKVVDEAVSVIVHFADALKKNAGKVVDAATDLMFVFLVLIASKAGDLAAAGLNVLIQFLNGIANNIGKVVVAAGNIIGQLVAGIAKAEGNIVTAGANAIISFITGIGNNFLRIVAAATNVAIAFVNGLANNAVRFANAAADALVNFLNGMADAIRTHTPQIRAAGDNIASAIVDGITGGLASRAGSVVSGAFNLGKSALGAIGNAIKSASPSKETIKLGQYMAQGLAIGLQDTAGSTNSAKTHGEQVLKALSDSLSKLPEALDQLDLTITITPVLDLSKVKDKALGLNDLLGNPRIVPTVSLNQANTIATTAEMAKAETPPPPPPPSGDLKFEQNIYSPSALSTNDIYKGTKSQIAQAKEALNI